MSRYLLINIGIVLFPLLFSFERNVGFYKKLGVLARSIGIVSTVYIIWDLIAVQRGDWGFNPLYTTGINFYGLPLEEILFFITVPYSIVFIFETIHFYLEDRVLGIPDWLFYITAGLLTLVAALFNTQYYTFTVLLFCAGFLLYGAYKKTKLLQSLNFYLTLAISYIPFLIVNYLLTEPPIVWYNDSAIWGGRFITIPYEDFFYSFSMISWWIYFYTVFKERKKFG